MAYNQANADVETLMWKREEIRERRAWLLCKHQAGHESIGCSGSNRDVCKKEYERKWKHIIIKKLWRQIKG